MEKSKEKILEYMRQVLDLGIKETLLVSKAPVEEGALIHGIPRIGVILDGQIEYRFFQDQKLKTTAREAGTAYYCCSNGYLYGNRTTPYKSISICYYGEYIRAIYSEYDTPHTTEFDTYYHTNTPLSKIGQKLLKTLDDIEKDKAYAESASKLLEALLLITMEDIRRSDPKEGTPSDRFWVEIELYLRLHHGEAISQKSIAKKFQLSPSYVSHLIKKISGNDFTSLLSGYRLEHATNLLRQTWLSVDEIAERCGFKYTSYFITRFKKCYGVTPHVFRNQNSKKS